LLASQLVLFLVGNTVDAIAVESVETGDSQLIADADGDVDVVAELRGTRRDRQHAAVGTGQVAGEEVQAHQLHPGVAHRADEVVDLAIIGHRLVGPRPPELDGVEARVLGCPGPLQQRTLGEQHRTVGEVLQVMIRHRRTFRIMEFLFRF
jgi:hypothetical protein